MQAAANTVVGHIARMAEDNRSGHSSKDMRQSLMDSIAIAIQRGNALMMRAGNLKQRLQ